MPRSRRTHSSPDLLVQMDDDFGIGMRRELVSAPISSVAQLGVVVDLAIEDQPHRAVFVRHRLMSGFRQVDDRQPAQAETNGAVDVAAGAVGAPMKHRIAHPLDVALVDSTPVEPHGGYDAAHWLRTKRRG